MSNPTRGLTALPPPRSVDGEGPTVGRHDRSAVGSTPANRSHAIHPGTVLPWGKTDRPLARWSVVELVGSLGRIGSDVDAVDDQPNVLGCHDVVLHLDDLQPGAGRAGSRDQLRKAR